MNAAGPGPGGTVAPGYESVRDAFAEAVSASAALAASVDGERVVDLWTGGGFTGDTATLLYSGTKGVAATVMLMLVEEGALGLDEPVCRYWPEFAAAGKEAITVTEQLGIQPACPRCSDRSSGPTSTIRAGLPLRWPPRRRCCPRGRRRITRSPGAGSRASSPSASLAAVSAQSFAQSWPTRSRPAWASACGRAIRSPPAGAPGTGRRL